MGAKLQEMLHSLPASTLSKAIPRSSSVLNLGSQDFQKPSGRSLPQGAGLMAGTVILISDNSVIGGSGLGDQKDFLGKTWPCSKFCGSGNITQIKQPLRAPSRDVQWELSV